MFKLIEYNFRQQALELENGGYRMQKGNMEKRNGMKKSGSGSKLRCVWRGKYAADYDIYQPVVHCSTVHHSSCSNLASYDYTRTKYMPHIRFSMQGLLICAPEFYKGQYFMIRPPTEWKPVQYSDEFEWLQCDVLTLTTPAWNRALIQRTLLRTAIITVRPRQNRYTKLKED